MTPYFLLNDPVNVAVKDIEGARLHCYTPPMPPDSLRWLYIDFNSFFASVEQQVRPELRGKPIIVVPVASDSTSAIAASYEAKAFGVKTGTPVWEAKKKCPGLVCVLASHEHYVNFHQRILVEIENHIPITAVCSIDEIACRLMDNETSIKRIHEIAASIKRGLKANIGTEVRCSIGVAPNRYLAKVATDMQKPDGLTLLPLESLPGRLFTLALNDLPGVGRGMSLRLEKAGIRTVADLWALDPHAMRHIWGGIMGEKLYHLLRGVELPDDKTTRRSVGHSHVLAPDVRPPAKARIVARRLTLKAASRLRRLDYYAGKLTLALRLESGMRLEAAAHCYRAADSLTFVHLLDELWRGLLRKTAPNARIIKISVTLTDLTAAADLQPELLPPLSPAELNARAKAERLSGALDTLNRRFGRDTVALGMMPQDGRSFSGTKVAFTRIPDAAEFLE